MEIKSTLGKSVLYQIPSPWFYLALPPAIISASNSCWLGIYSQGKLYVRGDNKIFRFQNGKSESLFLQRKNPRRIAWTTLYRRQHRKGVSEVSGWKGQQEFPFPSASSMISGYPGMYPFPVPTPKWKNHTKRSHRLIIASALPIIGSCQKAHPSYG